MEIFVTKTPSNQLAPNTAHDQELLKAFKVGQPAKVKLTRVRNYEFHKKFFALMNLAFDYWEPPEHGEGSAWAEKIEVEKSFDRFRKDVIILAGYYEATYRLNGDVRLEAKSIAFHNMSEEDFETLYTKTIDAIVKHVLKNYTDEMLRSVLDQVEEFE